MRKRTKLPACGQPAGAAITGACVSGQSRWGSIWMRRASTCKARATRTWRATSPYVCLLQLQLRESVRQQAVQVYSTHVLLPFEGPGGLPPRLSTSTSVTACGTCEERLSLRLCVGLC
eukprot:scaffold921_cov397-Prasinococcus_capsulatus_cf.AAC.15